MKTAPDPVTVDWLRDLLERRSCTQREAARLLHVDDVTVRRWATGARGVPWAAAELLRRLLDERGPGATRE
jgi:transcriptional regulator with XRE-family HTH domain